MAPLRGTPPKTQPVPRGPGAVEFLPDPMVRLDALERRMLALEQQITALVTTLRACGMIE